jgi:hypothetical protein
MTPDWWLWRYLLAQTTKNWPSRPDHGSHPDPLIGKIQTFRGFAPTLQLARFLIAYRAAVRRSVHGAL